MAKKEIATSFLALASSGKVCEAFDKYIHLNFIHHLVFFKGDRESFLQAMEENAREFPDKTYETIHALEDGDLVAVHGKVTLSPKVFGVIHIFHFEGDKIIESWEASQEELKDSPNENGLFLTMTKAQKQIALQFNEYINNRNIDGLATLMTDDHAFIDTANVEFRGKKRALEAWRGFFEAFPEYKNIFEQVLIKDDRVIMIGHSVCPSNEALDGPAIWTAKIKDGQVSKWRVYENTPSNRASLDVA